MIVDRTELESPLFKNITSYGISTVQVVQSKRELQKILIVTQKLLTGFDAPILYYIYLGKPMRDHVLLQAIARVNRPYEDDGGQVKPCDFVLDFVGIFEKLEEALAFLYAYLPDWQDRERQLRSYEEKIF